MKLRNKSRQLRIAEEGKPPKSVFKKYNLSRYIYFLFLVFVILYVGSYIVDKTFFIKGVGLITFNPLEVRAEEDVKVKKVYIREGGFIKKDDNLFLSESITPLKTRINDKTDEEIKILKRISQTEKEINLSRIKNTYLKTKLKNLERKYEHLSGLISYELVIREDLENVKQEIEETKLELVSLKDETRIFRKYRKQLKKQLDLLNGQPEVLTDAKRRYHFTSPINGQVIKVSIKEEEVALKGETIVKLASLEKMKIKGFFDPGKMKSLKTGMEVRLEFPDGTSSKGIIDRFYYSTLPLPVEFQKTYEPVRRNMVADIIPLPGEEKKWLKYHKLSVKIIVEGNRFSWFIS